MNYRLTRMFAVVITIFALAMQLVVQSSTPVQAASQPSTADTAIAVSVHSIDGVAIAGAHVSVAPLGLQGTTDASGRLRMEHVTVKAPTKVQVAVKADGYRNWIIRNVSLYLNDTLQVDAPLSVDHTGRQAPEVVDVAAPRAETGAPQTNDDVSTLAAGTNTTPPTTIRVYRVNLGRIDTVDFRYYVKHVLPNEWIPSWPAESLRSGAMAVKTYGWYRTMYAKYPGSGYDVKDTTADQVYNPSVSYASTDAAVDATWNYRMTRNGAIFQAQYCAGSYNGSRTSGQCSELYGWTAGNYMSQNGSHYLADHGYTWRSILTFYYSNIVIGDIGGTLPMPSWPVLRNGDTGVDVKAAQYLLRHRGYGITADGIFGSATESAVRDFQSRNGLTVDGIIGANTFSKLIYTVRQGDSNEAVRAIQVLVNVTNDGIFGSGTDSAVRSLQATYGLVQDGIVGPQTWQAAFGK